MKLEEFQAHLRSLSIDETLQPDTVFDASFQAERTLMLALPSDHPSTTSQAGLKLGKTIGEGGMGVVRAATQLHLHREVAVKSLRDDPSESQCSALLLEALITGGLQHPSIVPVYSLAQNDAGLPIIIMKLVEGVTWLECIQDSSVAPGIDPNDILGWHLDVLSKVCQAVHYAHSRGIIHRDIKPENVMLGEFGEVYVVDWGIAVTTDIDKSEYLRHVKDTMGIAGTPAYMAPEMTLGVGELVTQQTDVYLLGATLAEVLTKEAPHSGQTIFEVLYRAHESLPIKIEGVSEELVAICHKAMAKDAGDRYQGAAELRLAIQQHLGHRASIRLTADALKHLRTLTESDYPDDGFRVLASEARFGLTEALKIWPENPTALAAKSDWLHAMASYELNDGHVPAARALLAQFQVAPQSLIDRIEATALKQNQRQTEIEELEEHHGQTDLGVGAQYRVRLALVGILFWTLTPLVGGVLTGWGARPLSHIRYIGQSGLLLAFVAITAIMVGRKTKNQTANRRIIALTASFCAAVPIYRVATMIHGIPTTNALGLELITYGLVFGGIAILSGRSGLPTILIYGLGSLASAIYPNYVYAFLAASNFLAFAWMSRIWADQRQASTH